MSKKNNLSKTAWDVFQYSVIPASFLLGMYKGASDILGNEFADAVIAGMNGGGLGTNAVNHVPLVYHRGIEGVHHIQHRLTQLEGKLKHIIKDNHIMDHLGLHQKGGGFETNKRHGRGFDPIQRVTKNSSSWIPFMKQLAGTMIAGATAGAAGYFGSQYVDSEVMPTLPFVGLGLKSQKGSGQSKDSWQWWKYMVPLTIGASVLMNYHDGFFDKDILLDDVGDFDDSGQYVPLSGEGFGPKVRKVSGFKKGVKRRDPVIKPTSSSWGSNFLSLAKLVGAAGLGIAGYELFNEAMVDEFQYADLF
jgi:hypothetical protein